MPLFFVHIPKTAGTSFRLAAEAYLGQSRIVYDYGKKAPETSAAVHHYVYQRQTPDFWALKQRILQEDAALLGGHVNAGRFVPIIGALNTLSFVRDPLQRMMSEYLHFVRHQDYQESFSTFYSRPTMQNPLSRFLQGIEVEAMGFLGITERYAQSLEIINARYGMALSLMEKNKGKPDVAHVHELEEKDIQALHKRNHKDIALFQYCCELFDIRYQLFKEGLPYAHARLAEATVAKVSGWAWWAQTQDAPVAVEVWVNGRHKATVQAVEHRPGLCRLMPPRAGYVGFSLALKSHPGDKVQCRVAETGQLFPPQPQLIREPA
nr:sulfotransferase family 2 domain-containing protein [uncultured Halomonas sp.]